MSATMADYEGFLATLGFLRADGPVLPSGPMMRDISQPGVAGRAYQRIGYAGRPFNVQTLAAFTFPNDLALAQILYAQYQTRNVTFTDDHGNTWYNLFVLEVQIGEARRISSGVGSLAGKNYILMATWALESAAVQY